MTQDNVQETQTQENVQEVATNSQSNSSDTSAELLHEVMAKKEKIGKLETQLAEIQAKDEERRQKQLIAEGKKDELIAELQGKIDALNPFKEKLETYEASRRATLIEKLPESKQEKFQNHPLDVLEDLVEEFAHSKPKVDNSAPGSFGGFGSLVEWAQKDPTGYKKANKRNSGITLGYGG